MIALCRLIPLPIVVSMLEVDVQIMGNKIVNGFREGDIMLYVSSFDKDERSIDVNGQETWGKD